MLEPISDDLGTARDTNTRLNRRCQLWEKKYYKMRRAYVHVLRFNRLQQDIYKSNRLLELAESALRDARWYVRHTSCYWCRFKEWVKWNITLRNGI